MEEEKGAAFSRERFLKLSARLREFTVPVNAGDLIAADRNGVIVIKPEEAEAVCERALDKRKRQQWVLGEMRRTGKAITKEPKHIPD